MINYVFGSAEADRAYGIDLVMATIAIMIAIVTFIEVKDYLRYRKNIRVRKEKRS